MRKEQAIMDPSSFGSTLLVAVLDEYGEDCLKWEPESVATQLANDTGMTVPKASIDRLMAAMAVLANDLFMKDVVCFNNTCATLDFNRSDGYSFIPCGAKDIMWGCAETRLILGNKVYEDSDWSHDVRRYAATVFSMNGITKAPPLLSFMEFDYNELDNRDAALGYDELMAETYSDSQKSYLTDLQKFALINMRTLLSQLEGLKLSSSEGSGVKEMLTSVTKQIDDMSKETL